MSPTPLPCQQPLWPGTGLGQALPEAGAPQLRARRGRARSPPPWLCFRRGGPLALLSSLRCGHGTCPLTPPRDVWSA